VAYFSKDRSELVRWIATMLIGALFFCLTGCSDSIEKTSIAGSGSKFTAVIDMKVCIPCSQRFCWVACPKRAINERRLSDNSLIYEVDPEKCISCGVCIQVCPYGAVSWKH